MSGLKGTEVSSNWKKLQEKLQAEKKNQPQQSNGVKRKRPDNDKPKAANAFKKPKTTGARPLKPVRPHKMGTTTSTPTSQPPLRSSLTTTHDIPPSDLTAAYGTHSSTPLSTPLKHKDEVNAGLHPTHKIGKYLALDCEMVGTGPPPHFPDHILARASLVNFHGEQVYDSAEHIRPGVARPFGEVQKTVASLLSGRILVGHALKNDLVVLGLSHPKRDLRDTSRYAKFRIESKGKPPALRNLAKQELGWAIQEGEHSSVEDARAAMGLVRKERVGFEEESRRVFGVGRKDDGNKGKGRGELDREEDGGEADEDDDMDLLDGEEGEDEVDGDEAPAKAKVTATVKKKYKKKKRTKRK
ncbi:3'-5' exonuclease [Saxophila tyrrhenica]|uniref:RNA exonuclease 4 n=1 Tax=Saxophila tyrrhenica TaxID=1690608 RepID=A0AAV9P2M0_9PEZI|nr:3'-5' exonuclease [Saxophila tyrrhenica]